MKSTGRYASVQLLNLLLAYVASNNYDIIPILKLSGIEPDILKDKNARVGIDQFGAVISAVSGMFGDGFTGLHLAEKVFNIYSKNHILMTIMSNCSTMEKAIEKLIQYHDISSNYIKLHVEKQSDYTELIWKTEIQTQYDLDSIIIEAALTSCAIMFRDFTMGKARFNEIHFAHSGPTDQSEYNRVFGCPVMFNNNENKIVFYNGDLSLPIVLSDPELLSMLELYAQKMLSKVSTDSLSERIISCLSEMIIQGKGCSIVDTAKKMGVGTRTLQKQLKLEDTTYRKLLEQVKKSIAIKSLENSESTLTDIAFLLGFSEQSAFNHAFRNWISISPGKYRNQFLHPNTRCHL